MTSKRPIKLGHFKNIWACGSGGKAREAGMENLNICGIQSRWSQPLRELFNGHPHVLVLSLSIQLWCEYTSFSAFDYEQSTTGKLGAWKKVTVVIEWMATKTVKGNI